jgi:hypothetical protein
MEKSTFIESFKKMPKHVQDRILEYVSSIVKEKPTTSGRNMKFDWQGGLKDIKESSVDLQHKANEWR